MRKIQYKDTKPELIVRRIVTKLGYRYRLHDKTLPGRPDLTLHKTKSVIFVHGCFWHQHSDCREGRIPRSRTEYWGPKLARNVERDQSHQATLSAGGWRLLTVWECELSDPNLSERIESFLNASTTRHPNSKPTPSGRRATGRSKTPKPKSPSASKR
jgi:DNA mismatch endonuclease (patch repair protein)